MHLIINYRISEQLPIADRKAFLLGGVAPDAAANKETSHFYRGSHDDYSRYIDYTGFLRTCESEANRPYVWGYFTHLIADDIWLKGFYKPWLRNRLAADPKLGPLYHNDFRLLNGQLVEHYGLRDALKQSVYGSPTAVDLPEVSAADVQALLPHVLVDLDYSDEVLRMPLQVFTFNQITGYIETSVEQGVRNLQAVLGCQSSPSASSHAARNG